MTNPIEKPALLTARQLGQMLSLSKTKIYQMIAAGQLPHSLRIGRSRRWRRNDINLWIEFDCPSMERFAELRAEAVE